MDVSLSATHYTIVFVDILRTTKNMMSRLKGVCCRFFFFVVVAVVPPKPILFQDCVFSLFRFVVDGRRTSMYSWLAWHFCVARLFFVYGSFFRWLQSPNTRRSLRPFFSAEANISPEHEKCTLAARLSISGSNSTAWYRFFSDLPEIDGYEALFKKKEEENEPVKTSISKYLPEIGAKNSADGPVYPLLQNGIRYIIRSGQSLAKEI